MPEDYQLSIAGDAAIANFEDTRVMALSPVVRPVEVDDPVGVRLMESYFAELRQRFGEFEPPSEAQLRADAARGVVLVVYDGEVAVGSGSLRVLDPQTAEVKRMFIVPEARGRGFGRVLLRSLEDSARALACSRVVLDTAATLVEAARMYLRAGYIEIERYNDNPYAARWFEKKLSSV